MKDKRWTDIKKFLWEGQFIIGRTKKTGTIELRELQTANDHNAHVKMYLLIGIVMV